MLKKPGRPAKPKLARDQILRETIALLQRRDGELSMRALAAHLNVDPMALYHYFPERDALWQAALEEVFCKLPTAPAPGITWQEAALSMLLAYHSLARRHFRLTQFLFTHGELRIPAIDTFNAALLRVLANARFDAARTELMRDLLVDYLHGYLVAEVHFSAHEKKRRAAQIETTLRWVIKSLC